MVEKYTPGIGVCAGSYMLKWDLLNQHIDLNRYHLKPGDKLNVFINLECIMKNLNRMKNLNSLILNYKQDVVLEIESAILNLVANYKSYFSKDKFDVKLYLYYTDLLSEEDQLMKVYNKHYRSYYKNEYLNNPKFSHMGELLTETIFPEVELIMQYIPNCYFIKSSNFDSSIIPKVIADNTEGFNILISGDVFDTLYMYDANFIMIYIKRRFKELKVTSNIDDTLQTIVKDVSPFDLNIFKSEMYYRLLLSIKGSKTRNIHSAKGFGYIKFMNILKDGIKKGLILNDFKSLNSIIELFPEKYREDIKMGFQCTNIDDQYQLLSDVDVDKIMNQIVDKIDITSIESLNNQRFFNYPINLNALLG